MGHEIAAHGRGDGGADDLQGLVEKPRNEGSLRHGRPQRLDPNVNPNRLDPPGFKRRLSGEIESEKVTIPRKMHTQPLLFREVWIPRDSTWTGRWRRQALRTIRFEIGRGAIGSDLALRVPIAADVARPQHAARRIDHLIGATQVLSGPEDSGPPDRRGHRNLARRRKHERSAWIEYRRRCDIGRGRNLRQRRFYRHEGGRERRKTTQAFEIHSNDPQSYPA